MVLSRNPKSKVTSNLASPGLNETNWLSSFITIDWMPRSSTRKGRKSAFITLISYYAQMNPNTSNVLHYFSKRSCKSNNFLRKKNFCWDIIRINVEAIVFNVDSLTGLLRILETSSTLLRLVGSSCGNFHLGFNILWQGFAGASMKDDTSSWGLS